MTTTKKTWLSHGCYSDMVSRYNPFGFKTANGASLAFKNYGKVYLYTMKKLVELFPRGYIDLVLFIHQMTHVPINDCNQVAKRFRNLGLKAGVMIVKVRGKDDESKGHFAEIMKALHTLSDTPFSAELFNDAWEQLKNDL